jgi:hypothetical protein
MKPMVMVLVLAAAACGGAQQGGGHQPNLQEFSSSELASEQLCEHAVSNFERNEFLSTSTPVRRKGLFNRTGFEWRHRDRVRRCQTSLSERQAACIASAPSLQYVRNCESFAELQ